MEPQQAPDGLGDAQRPDRAPTEGLSKKTQDQARNLASDIAAATAVLQMAGEFVINKGLSEEALLAFIHKLYDIKELGEDEDEAELQQVMADLWDSLGKDYNAGMKALEKAYNMVDDGFLDKTYGTAANAIDEELSAEMETVEEGIGELNVATKGTDEGHSATVKAVEKHIARMKRMEKERKVMEKEMKAMKEKMKVMEDDHDTKMRAIEEDHRNKIKAMEEGHDTELKATKEEYEKNLNATMGIFQQMMEVERQRVAVRLAEVGQMMQALEQRENQDAAWRRNAEERHAVQTANMNSLLQRLSLAVDGRPDDTSDDESEVGTYR